MSDEWKAEDIASVGKAMYEEIRGQLEETHKGKIVVIDVKSGDYEIADSDLEATLRIFERNSNALTWGERVGYSAPYSMDRIVRPNFPSLDSSLFEKLRTEFEEFPK